MPRRSSGDTLRSNALPLTALNIGLWEDDVDADRLRGDAVMARMYGLSEAEAHQGISWTRLSSIFHPEDLVWDRERRRRVREEGGLFVWEHRIVPTPGIVRWVLVRGRFDRDANGRRRGRGIVIDLTDTRIEEHIEGLPRFHAMQEAKGSAVERMAEHALELRELMHELDAGRAARLKAPLETLMFELGREIAASLPEERPTRAPMRPRHPKLH